jgi:hypothetical protein
VVREELRRILNIIADKTQNNPSSVVTDSAVIRESGLPESEARKYVSEIASLNLFIEGIKVGGADFRMLCITKEGIQELLK